MIPSEGHYGLRDLVQLAVESGGLGSYTQERYEILRRLLGVRTDLLVAGGGPAVRQLQRRPGPDGKQSLGHLGAPGLAVHAVEAIRAVRNPFRGYLEAPPDVGELFDRHNEMVASQAAALTAALTRLAIEAIGSAEPDTAHASVTMADLRSAGWPDAPSPLLDDELY